MEGNRGYSTADENVTKLAEESFAYGLSSDDLAWLTSPEAEHVWIFGQRFGALDAELEWYPQIVTSSAGGSNPLLFASYINGHADIAGEDWREAILDQLAKTHPKLAFECTCRGSTSEHGARRLLELAKGGCISATLLGYLHYGAWTRPLSVETFREIVATILVDTSEQATEGALSLISQRLRHKPDEADEVCDVAWAAIERVQSVPRNQMFTFYWQTVASHYLSRDPSRAVDLILRVFERSGDVFISSDEIMQLLENATQQAPEPALEKIGAVLLSDSDWTLALRVSLEGWFGNLIPVDTLMKWAEANKPRGPVMAFAGPVSGWLKGNLDRARE
jgi:hypothetical protein